MRVPCTLDQGSINCVVLNTVIAMLLPFFVDVVALIGALGFWPLTIFLPVEMHVRQASIPSWGRNGFCFVS